MRAIALQFGFLLLAFWALLKVTQYALFTEHLVRELWTILFALVFIALGILLYRRFGPAGEGGAKEEGKALVPVESPVARSANPTERSRQLGISKREYEVLTLIAQGLSNQQIAERLFISQSTVKSHVSKLLVKLEAKRRTQAIRNAREKGLLGSN
ncbi:MAG: response regulator transcription factor [Bacteroidota bacterium]